MNGRHTDERKQRGEQIAGAARQAAERNLRGREEPEPSLGSRLGQIGILGWAIVLPTLMGLGVGHWLDRTFGTRVFFSAPLLMIGAAVGFWSAWKWMHRQQRNHHE
ncbi:ATP synthase protein I [Paraburkholderia sp. BL23I1N1]|uniref:AtpZ/AtpI family protein n=1 Tax=Paraburkholderia sp. BL23I1N1 TaxID=1938802 RepID=UPI000E771007|nr:AtpZ/AtpI family protein [Paraburkholderia sp. BL23I1N1]RKE37929.1 ATP synthase protein I [Paraburkholderia sp. BL23I1N1]